MKTTYRYLGLFGCMACLGIGGSAYADVGDSRSVISGNPRQVSTTNHPPEIVVERTKPKIEIRNGMLFVPPRGDIKFEIATVPPDPNIDYKIGFIGPRAHLRPMESRARTQNTIRGNRQRK